MTDTYKGESPGKKRARFGFWCHVSDVQGSNFIRKKHLVLASREGGDISVLLGMGVPAANIVAVERERSAAEACAEKWPQVDVHIGDAIDVLAEQEQKDPGGIQTVFLDFCGPITRETMFSCSEAFRLMYPGPSQIFAAAFLKGRERRQRPLEHRLLMSHGWANRRRRRAKIACATDGWAKQFRRTLDSQLDVDPMPLMHQMGNICKISDPGELRLMFLSTVLDESSTHRYSEPLLAINYFGAGVPMCITSMAVRNRLTKNAPDRGHDVVFVGDPDSSAARAYRAVAKRDKASMEIRPQDWIKNFCINEPDSKFASLVLNMPSGTIAAWKAHATRGTYMRSAAE